MAANSTTSSATTSTSSSFNHNLDASNSVTITSVVNSNNRASAPIVPNIALAKIYDPFPNVNLNNNSQYGGSSSVSNATNFMNNQVNNSQRLVSTSPTSGTNSTIGQVVNGVKQSLTIGESGDPLLTRVVQFLLPVGLGYVVGSYLTGKEFYEQAKLNDEIEEYASTRKAMPIYIKYTVPRGENSRDR